MTCGIYLLKFAGTHKVYVGQSQNIEKRYKQHVSNIINGTANYKLLEAYNVYNTPICEIVAETSIQDLDAAEDEAIQIWNAVKNGFNIHFSANEAPTYTGYGSGNSKYLKEELTQVFKLLVHTDKTFAEIQNITGVPEATIATISSTRSHIWLKDDFPEDYNILVTKLKTRRRIISTTIVSDKLSAKSQGIVYPSIKDPEGNIYAVDNAYKFAKQHGLAPNHFQEVLNGHRKSHKGWKVCQEEVQL
jgi:predicted GIY-YIG superfamily endonuclease